LETRGAVDVLDDGSHPSQFSSKPLTPKRNEVPQINLYTIHSLIKQQQRFFIGFKERETSTQRKKQEYFPKGNLSECSSKEHQHTTHTLMNYLVIYDKYLEEGLMLLNARMTFKNEREAITFAHKVRSNPKNNNIKLHQL
jgi:hypothetical protein